MCGSPRIIAKTVTYFRDPKLVCPVRICGRCGFVRCPKEDKSHYTEVKDFKSLPGATRAGTPTKKGREFYMAQMAVDILNKDKLDILVYGPGRSLDNHHMEKLPGVTQVAIGDIMQVRDDAEFIDANEPPKRRFSVVIACEVIEHFRDPWSDFDKLLRLVDRDGVVVCGTNITDGGDLNEDRYIYFPDHTAYYSPQSLRMIAEAFGYHLDFRYPGGATPRRKRYVIFSKSRHTMEKVADYFGAVHLAPAEPLPPKKKK